MSRKTQITLIRLVFLILFLAVIISGKMVLWLVLFALTLPAAILFGRLYCGYACPMNTVMVAADALVRKSSGKRREAPAWLKQTWIPWLILALSIPILLGGKRLLQINIPLLPFFVLLSFVLTLFFKPEVFHHFICPFGALQRLFGRWSMRSHLVQADLCIGCKKCEKVCPNLAVRVDDQTRKANIRPADCLQCQNCVQVCPTHAIAYQRIKK
ncbi:MAG: 4Fe-4S binding protein [Clostridiaceae bacterium]|jgi:polyferredoxin|nr:4Fe-4S binding protein [Clostridiaceae bacterium]